MAESNEDGADADGGFAEYAAGALPRLRRIAYLLCQDWHRADDLTQSALTSVYVHWRKARAAQNRDAYVGAVLMNAFLAEQRTAWWKRTSVRAEPAAALPTATTAPPLEDALDLRAALRTLPPRRRATVVLRYYCDYSIEQTAEALGCSTGTVKSQTAKALAQLRELFESPAPAGPEGEGETDGAPLLHAAVRMGAHANGRTL